MEPQEFLAAVLPPPGHGYYCAVALPSKVQKFSEDISYVNAYAQRWAEQGKDAYFALYWPLNRLAPKFCRKAARGLSSAGAPDGCEPWR